MSRINELTPKLRKAPQPPLSHAGAPADSDRAKRPPLVQPSAPDSELNPGDRVEGFWVILESRPENSEQLSKRMKTKRL